MYGDGREEAPFSGRVWQEIDRVVHAVREANCTARRFLEVDGPYGMGLTSVSDDEESLAPETTGATSAAWGVTAPDQRGVGTLLMRGATRSVPLIASEFTVGMRAIDAFEAGCQPLDLCRATQAARAVALEEERLLYYGRYSSDDPVALLRISNVRQGVQNSSELDFDHLFTPPSANTTIDTLSGAVTKLAERGYAGPFALVAAPALYLKLYQPTGDSVLRVDLVRRLFRGGIYLAPVIHLGSDPLQHVKDDPQARTGAIITMGRAYSRLAVGQDWVTTYRGRDSLLYRFLIMSSLQLRVCDTGSIQVLTVKSSSKTEEAAGISSAVMTPSGGAGGDSTLDERADPGGN